MSAKKYGKLVMTETGFRGAYPLIVPVKVGDYFELGREGVMVHLGNVFNWPGWAEGVPVDSEDLGGSETYYADCNWTAGAEAGVKATTPFGPDAAASITLSFMSSSGFVLAYGAAKRHRVREIPDVQREIAKLAQQGWWKEEWILVTEVIAAESATLVVSASRGSSLSLHAQVSLPHQLKDIQVANPKLGWSASSWSGGGFSSLCKPGTPLYHCIGVKKGWLGAFRTVTLGSDTLGDAFVQDDPFYELERRNRR